MKDEYRIVLADDHRVIRQGIQRIIEEKAGLKVVGGVDDHLELMKILPELRPDMVIMDLYIPFDGIQAIRRIKTDYPGVKVLVLTMYKEKQYFSDSIGAGADGYLVKEDADTELYAAIEAIRQGRHFTSSVISGTGTDTFVDMDQGTDRPAGADRLTLRQMEILKLIADGRSSKEIADQLFISVRTVENHRANIMKRLGIKKNTELVRFAIRKGYIPASDT